jgi:septum formation topological specificity factor MinE
MKPMLFRNFGGMRQFVVTDEADLAQIDKLDAARWAATSAPVRDFQCDPAVLAFLDPEGTGRIRVSQILAARDWLFARLARKEAVAGRNDVLALSDLSTAVPEGARLRQAADHVLAQLQQADRARLSLDALRSFRTSYAKTLANGDGVIPPDLLPEPELADFVKQIIAVVGSAPDASGFVGVGAEQVDKYLARAQAWLDWKAAGAASPATKPWGEDTAGVQQLVNGLDAKVSEYFWQCDLLRQTERSAEAIRDTDEQVKAVAAQPGPAIEQHLAEAPLAKPNTEGKLLLDAPVNGYYAARLSELRTKVVPRVLGDDASSLTRAEWGRIKEALQAHVEWQAARPAEPFDTLPAGAVEAALTGNVAERLRVIIARDRAASEDVEQLASLEKLILLQRWLVELTNNFVNFSAVYDPAQTALIRAGSLVIDGRRLEFCLKVQDRAAHRKTALESSLFLVYCAITDRDGNAPAYDIVAPVTVGERGRIRLGKRGLFIDRAGREWDATVVDIVENPVSIIEAIRAPFRRASAFISKRVEELTSAGLAAQEKASTTSLGQSVDHSAAVVAAAPGAAPPPAAAKPPTSSVGMRDLLLGGGIAFAALGSALAYVVTALAAVRPLNAVVAVGSLTLAIVALSALLGWIKLRRRDMAPLLEANGWALNVHMSVRRRLGRIFTRVPPLPPEAVIDKGDVLEVAAPKHPVLRVLLILAIAVAIGLAIQLVRSRS